MSGKQKFSAEQVIAAIREGHTPTGAAAMLKCDPDTIRNYAERYPTVRATLKSERRGLVDIAELGLRSALLNHEAWAIAFTLKTLGKEDGYVERTQNEVTGKDGAPLCVVVRGPNGRAEGV